MKHSASSHRFFTVMLLSLGLAACQKQNESGGLPDAQANAPSLAVPSVPQDSANAAKDANAAPQPTEIKPTPGAPGAADIQAKPDEKTPAQVAQNGHYSGTAVPQHSAQLGPKGSGVLVFLGVEEGDKVKKGQPLFRLDSKLFQLGVKQAQTAIKGAKIAMQDAERQLARQKELAEKGSTPAAALERIQAAYDGALVQYQQASVALQLAKRNLADTTVVAPFDGVVTNKLKEIGETVTMMPPTVVLVIQDASVLEVRARVPERLIGHIKPGAAAVAHFSAVGVTRPAKVDRVQPAIDPMTRTAEVVALVDNQDGALKAGMYVELEL